MAGIGLSAATATTYSLTFSLKQTPSVGDPLVTLYGQIKPSRSALRIRIQVEIAGKWQGTSLSTLTNRAGTWRIEATATALSAIVKYRATTMMGTTRLYSGSKTIKIQRTPEMSNYDPATLISESGPGGRIHGIDISRWQHPADAPIDFTTMYNAGIRFVMIKASDSRDIYDALALKYLVMDHNAAQAAGIYTGFYYYASLPDTTSPATVITDAQAQAQKAIWRLASLGGYTNRDLSFALDLEDNCVRWASNETCQKYLSRDLITLWANTWLSDVGAKTGRAPIMYSYPQFLENAMARSADLQQYPLWIAHYSLNPGDPLAQPGQKTAGCFVHSWTVANCSSLWTMWQYTSCGIAKKYGVPGTRVDLDVFRGTPSAFLDLMQGTWVPEVADLMPTQEPSQSQILSVKASTTDQSVVVKVNVTRPTGDPVVTGTVKFVADPSNPLLSTPMQSATRASSGRWTLSIRGLQAGTWLGQIVFNDISGTHATSSAPVAFTIAQGPTPSPSIFPSPTPTATPTKTVAVDPCKNQIKN
jgi:GH25 family lysozyme M1 (1,4-beta-N-acetylmuramidase)